MFRRWLLMTVLAVMWLALADVQTPLRAQTRPGPIKVGVIIGMTGPGASLGIPYRNTFSILPPTLGGLAVDWILLDDETEPTNAVRHARKLITEDRVDLLMGSTNVPTATAVTEVSAELQTPQIALTPLGGAAAKNPWVFSIPQSASIVMGAVAEHMQANNVRRVAYIGLSDSWGDLVLGAIQSHAQRAGITLITDERYGRLDTSVTGQVLRVLAARPDAVLVGGSGTPGALPHIALAQRGFAGPIYNTPAVVNQDFLRVGGKAVEGAIAPTGPVMVAEQLPDGNPIKHVSLAFTRLYESHFGKGSRNAFAAYSYDAWLLADQAVRRALMQGAAPGTAQFRQALRKALETSTEVVGTHGVYSMSASDHAGVDERSRVLVQVQNGDWKLVD